MVPPCDSQATTNFSTDVLYAFAQLQKFSNESTSNSHYTEHEKHLIKMKKVLFNIQKYKKKKKEKRKCFSHIESHGIIHHHTTTKHQML